MAQWAHLYEINIGGWVPKKGDSVVWRPKRRAMIRKGKVLVVSGKFALVEIEFEYYQTKTKKVHVEFDELRPIGVDAWLPKSGVGEPVEDKPNG